MTRRSDDDDDAEHLSTRVVHYHQTKNGDSNTSRYNTMLLACLLAIVGFLGVQVWTMNGRIATLEANMATLIARP